MQLSKNGLRLVARGFFPERFDSAKSLSMRLEFTIIAIDAPVDERANRKFISGGRDWS